MRAAYLAVQDLLKNPLSPLTSALWEVAEAGLRECNCETLERDFLVWLDDDHRHEFTID